MHTDHPGTHTPTPDEACSLHALVIAGNRIENPRALSVACCHCRCHCLRAYAAHGRRLPPQPRRRLHCAAARIAGTEPLPSGQNGHHAISRHAELYVAVTCRERLR
jgi:hypothetical protein